MAKWKPETDLDFICEWKSCQRAATWRLGDHKTWSCDRHLVKMIRKFPFK